METSKLKHLFVFVILANLVSVSACAARIGGSAEGGPRPGMDASGEVVDSSLVEAGDGRAVQGINDWHGEISGKSFPGAKFDQLKIGMPLEKVAEKLGEPDGQERYVTGKLFIPYYFGSDTERFEAVYTNQGRLVFAREGGFSNTMILIWIIYDKDQPGAI